jgi:cytidine deaminase
MSNLDLLSSQDREDIELAHQYRLSLSSSPSQSSFRVLALLFFETDGDDSNNPKKSLLPPWVPKQTSDGRSYIVGTNDEPGYMGGAICAERAAMVQLRFVPSFQITKLVIATDSLEPISPGLLCREFLAGHASVPWDVPVISAGCICRNCQLRDQDLFLQTKSPCQGDGDTTEHHSIPTLQTTIRQLYPYPSPYTRLTASQSMALGEAYCEKPPPPADENEPLEETARRLLELAIMEAKSNISELHPVQFGAAVVFEDGTIVTSHQASALEYGCTLDAVSQLTSHITAESNAPVLLVQADQFGIAHAPFAPARSFLSEHGYGDCLVLLHDAASDDVENANAWKLRQVSAADLAPNAPSWTTSTDR